METRLEPVFLLYLEEQFFGCIGWADTSGVKYNVNHLRTLDAEFVGNFKN